MKAEFNKKIEGVEVVIRYETEDFDNHYDSNHHQIDVIAGGVEIQDLIKSYLLEEMIEECRVDYMENHFEVSEDEHNSIMHEKY